MASNRIIRSLILGAPGSGKGTISSRLVKNFKLTHLASGDILRNQISAKTATGKEAEKYLVKGQLVPDEVVVKLISDELKMIQSSWLLDGFPRTLSQAKALSQSHDIDLVINLDVPFDTIRQRLEKRWIHASSGRVYHTDWNPPKEPGIDDVTGEALIQRNDDKPETVKKRLELYEEMTKPLLDYYSKQGVLKSFFGTESDVIYPDIHNYLHSFT